MITIDSLLGIAVLITLLCVSALCLYAIVVLREARGLLSEFRLQLELLSTTMGYIRNEFKNEFKEIRLRLLGTLTYFEETAKNSALITGKIHADLEQSQGIFAEIEALRAQIQRVRELIETGIVTPARQIATTINAAIKGVTAFLQTMQKK